MSAPPAYPLAGCRVAITRPAAEAVELRARLLAYGAEVECIACLQTTPVALTAPLRACLLRLGSLAWAAFASARAVDAVDGLLQASGAAWPARWQVAAVGTATAARLRGCLPAGCRVHVASPQSAEGLVALLLARAVAGRDAIFIPRARRGRALLPAALRRARYEIHPWVVYETLSSTAAEGHVHLVGPRLIVLCTSPSAVRGLCARTSLPSAAQLISIGPSTTAACEAAGLQVAAEASPHSLDGLLLAALSIAPHLAR